MPKILSNNKISKLIVSPFSIFLIVISCQIKIFADTKKTSVQEKREAIFKQIEEELHKQVELELDQEELAKKLNIKFPLKKAELSAEQIIAECRTEAEQKAKENFAGTSLQTIVQEAERRFPLFKVGDKVNIRLLTKAYPRASGTVMAISDERVQIGIRWIPMKDIVEEQRTAFDYARTMDLREAFVMRQNSMQLAIQKNKQEQILNQCIKNKMKSAGYVLDSEGTPELTNQNNWLSNFEIFQEELKAEKKMLEKKLRPEIENRLFTENNFRYNEKRKEWQPKGFLQNIKNLFN